MVRRSTGLEAGSAPPDLTAMVMSFAMRANCFAMRFHRANIVCLRTSKMRPMRRYCSVGRAPTRARLGQLRLQRAHAPPLAAERALDLAQPALQVEVLLFEPLLLDARPVGDRGEECLVLVRNARTQLLDVALPGGRQLRKARLGALELHGEQCPLYLEVGGALQPPGKADELQARDQPLGRIELPPAHAVAVVVRKDVVEVVVALSVGDERDRRIVTR